ncbi:hypothetical protein EG329_004958 [Mollisiaceae sp. DMI_Dod_QoI]|nr:hypothetical protein EG329_004958 [Helotiales sp. DMI_Dod_QoI]
MPNRHLSDGWLPDGRDFTPLIQCIENTFSVLELDLVERLLLNHPWLEAFENRGDDTRGCLAAFQKDMDETLLIIVDFLAIVLGCQLLLDLEAVVRAKIGQANGVDSKAICQFIRQNPKWTTEQFLTLWIQDVPAGSLRDRLCKNVEAIAEVPTFAQWASYLVGENLFKNTRVQYLQLLGTRLQVSVAENARLKRKIDGLNDENMDLEEDRYVLGETNERLLVRSRQQPVSLVSPGDALFANIKELKRLEVPIQCMIYRGYLERLAGGDKKTGSTPGDVWREFWPQAVDAAEENQDLIWTTLLKGSYDRAEAIKSSGKGLYARLSGPIHDQQKVAHDLTFQTWCYVMEWEILPVIKAMAIEKRETKMKAYERESWR